MGIMPTDILLKTFIEASINDLRINDWLLYDVFNPLALDPLAKTEYGYKEVNAAVEWFKKNQINVFAAFRVDLPTLPCITIVQNPTSEALDRTSLSDEGSTEEIEHRKVNQVIHKIIDNFTPKAYEKNKGQVTLPANFSTEQVAVGQYLVSTKTGKAYQIKEIIDNQIFKITEGTDEDFTNAYVAPQTSLWNLHREISFINESFTIGLHAQSDPVVAMWLRQVILYSIMRYKEAWLEGRGFELSTWNCTAIELNTGFDPERVFSSYITLTGQIEMNWIKFIAPKFQKVSGGIKIGKIVVADGTKPPAPYVKTKTPPAYLDEVKNQAWEMDGDDDEDLGM